LAYSSKKIKINYVVHRQRERQAGTGQGKKETHR